MEVVTDEMQVKRSCDSFRLYSSSSCGHEPTAFLQNGQERFWQGEAMCRKQTQLQYRIQQNSWPQQRHCPLSTPPGAPPAARSSLHRLPAEPAPQPPVLLWLLGRPPPLGDLGAVGCYRYRGVGSILFNVIR